MYTYYVCIEQENNLQSKLCANAFLVISISMSSGYIKNKAKIKKKKNLRNPESTHLSFRQFLSILVRRFPNGTAKCLDNKNVIYV